MKPESLDVYVMYPFFVRPELTRRNAQCVRMHESPEAAAFSLSDCRLRPVLCPAQSYSGDVSDFSSRDRAFSAPLLALCACNAVTLEGLICAASTVEARKLHLVLNTHPAPLNFPPQSAVIDEPIDLDEQDEADSLSSSSHLRLL